MWQYLAGIKYHARNDRLLCPYGSNESAIEKSLNWLSCLITGAFGVKAKMHTIVQHLLHSTKAFATTVLLLSVNKYRARFVNHTEDWDPRHFNLCQCFIRPGYPRRRYRDVYKGIVVNHHHIILTVLKMFFTSTYNWTKS